MQYDLLFLGYSTGLMAAMIAASFLCQRWGKRLGPATDPPAVSAVVGAVFALLGLLVAFTFSAAFARLDARRQLIVQEANAIGTAYLRIDLLPSESQPPMRKDFREYVATRRAMYESLGDISATDAHLKRSAELQQSIWKQAVAASGESQPARMLVLPALNEMIDIVTTRTVAIHTHAPVVVWLTLGLLAISCAGLTGYSNRHADWRTTRPYDFALAAIMAIVLFLILDIEYPRFGFVRLDLAVELLKELEASF